MPGEASIQLDHCVIHVTDWKRSTAFYGDVLGAEVIARGKGYAYRLRQQLHVHGPGLSPAPLARVPAAPGNSDQCFIWPGPVQGALDHLAAQHVTPELGPVERRGARGKGQSVYFRGPDGSLLECISYE